MCYPEHPADPADPPRLTRERATITEMIRIYCQGQHGGAGEPCDDCRELVDYALCRLDQCPFGAAKTSCEKCPIHCYKPAMRARIRQVMAYAGPRMLLHHPLLTIRHKLRGTS